MSKENIPVITDREELYDKCENMEQLFDKYYLPLLDKHYSKTYQLQQENQKYKEKYENAVADYETTMFEKEQLKKQVDEYKKLGFKYLQDKNNNLETQQKEFIEWLEAMSKMYENEYKDIDIAGHYNCVLSKYKEIIGDDK